MLSKGSVDYGTAMNMTLLERQLLAETIEKQMKQEAKNPLLKLFMR